MVVFNEEDLWKILRLRNLQSVTLPSVRTIPCMSTQHKHDLMYWLFALTAPSLYDSMQQEVH